LNLVGVCSDQLLEENMGKQSEKSRHIGGKPNTRDEAANRKSLAKNKATSAQQNPKSPKPKNADVGDMKRDR
jgi:hypothetical protein